MQQVITVRESVIWLSEIQIHRIQTLMSAIFCLNASLLNTCAVNLTQTHMS